MTPLKAAKAGRHRDIVKYIEDAFAAKKAADMAAWEAQLPNLLDELAPPKQHKKTKAKRKAASAGNAMPKSPCGQEAEALSGIALEIEAGEATHLEKMPDRFSDESSQVAKGFVNLLSQGHDVDEGDWTEVVRKGCGKACSKVS